MSATNGYNKAAGSDSHSAGPGGHMAKRDDGEIFVPRGGTSASDERDRALRAMIDKDRAATDAKTARLKALRLAQESLEPPPAAPKPRRKKAG